MFHAANSEAPEQVAETSEGGLAGDVRYLSIPPTNTAISVQEKRPVLTEVNLNVLPNPTSDLVTVTFRQDATGGQLEVLDATGRSVHSQRAAGATAVLHLGHLEHGNYWLAYTQGPERIATALAVDGIRR